MGPERLVDPFGRRIDYLRLSVTDRCNLRCLYCMPPEGIPWAWRTQMLSDAEIQALVRVAAGLGISKVRLTGGEPLVRTGIVNLVRGLSQVPGVRDLSLSTNGMLLGRMAQALKACGLARVNVSLDTLRPERFRQVTRLGELGAVLRGIEQALRWGLEPVKINMVVMRGVNDDEIPDFVALTRSLPVHVRFIELMPIGETGFFSRQHWLPLPEIRVRCGPLEPLPGEDAPRGSGPAVYFRPPGALGTVGFIAALSCNFCARCNRLRLTSTGRLVPCLAGEEGVDLRGPLREGAGADRLEALFRQAVAGKPERHHMHADHRVRESFMCALGG
jgi:cyclic pyranopterin phosphate synthase